MILSKLYSNEPDVFVPVNFQPGLNVVLAEIRLPKNRAKDSHNLGKSLFGRILDFCLLLQVTTANKPSFLMELEKEYPDFALFLEIKLFDNTYITIRRGVEHNKICLVKHRDQDQDFAFFPLEPPCWDHINISLKEAKNILDGVFDLESIKPWSFRNLVGYLLRSQNDYGDVFQLKNEGREKAKDASWKPFMSQMLGFNGDAAGKAYKIRVEIDHLKKRLKNKRDYLSDRYGKKSNQSEMRGRLQLLKTEIEEKENFISEYSANFYPKDKKETQRLVNSIDEEISRLNVERYRLEKNQNLIDESLKKDKIIFDPDKAKKLFEETGIYFDGQIKKTFEELIEFNKVITEERYEYLKVERDENIVFINRINDELERLNKQRSDLFSFIKEKDIIVKYQDLYRELTDLNSKYESYQQSLNDFIDLDNLNNEILELEDKVTEAFIHIHSSFENAEKDESSVFYNIRSNFNDIIKKVIDQGIILTVSVENEKILYDYSILNENSERTKQDEGHTYKKLLCIAYDLAVSKAHIGEKYPRFLYHDGVFENLDPRPKGNLYEVMRQYANSGIQHIITILDYELHELTHGGKNRFEPTELFDETELILTLHDEGEKGRLFRMKPW